MGAIGEFSPVVLAMSAAGVTFIVDMLGEVQSWVKVVASYVVSLGFVCATGEDIVATSSGAEPGVISVLLSALVLAGMASKVVHPLKESLKNTSSGKDEG